MARIFSGKWLLLILVLAFADIGCHKDTDNTVSVDVQTTAKSEITEEVREILEMKTFLEEGKYLPALCHARNLMDSSNKVTRAAALETMLWIGKRAMPEIVEMINDDDSEISADALRAWEMAFGEIDDASSQADALFEAVSKLKRYDDINTLLIHASEIEECVVLPMLARLIDANPTNVLGECAREAYSFIADGDVYDLHNTTNKEVLQ